MAEAQSETYGRKPLKARGPSKDARPRARHGDGPRWGHWPASEPRSFGPPLVGVDGMSVLPVKASLEIGEANLDLFKRQAQALTAYWQAVSGARTPWDIFAANTNYWTHWCRNILATTDDSVRK